MTFGGESDDLKSSSPGERWRSSEPPRGEALTGFAPNGIFGGTDSRGRGRGGAEGEIFIRLQRNCIMVNSGGNGGDFDANHERAAALAILASCGKRRRAWKHTEEGGGGGRETIEKRRKPFQHDA